MNDVLPLLPPDPAHCVFRFPKIKTAAAWYAIHRQLLAKYAIGWRRQAEPDGEEMPSYTRVVENYGPRHP